MAGRLSALRLTAEEQASRQARQVEMQFGSPYPSEEDMELDEHGDIIAPYGSLGSGPPTAPDHAESAWRQNQQAQMQSADPYPFEEYILRNEEGDISLEVMQSTPDFDVDELLHKRFPWSRGVDLDDPQWNTPQRTAEWYMENADPNVPALDYSIAEPPAVAFVKNLISLDIDEMPADEQTCMICSDHYWTGTEAELPLQLPCGHVFGEHCLIRWLTGIGGPKQHGNCPMCREHHVDVNMPISTEEGLEQLLGNVDYVLNRMGPLRLTTEGKKKWQDVKDYVEEHLYQAAADEQELRGVFDREMTQSIIVQAVAHLLNANEQSMLQERLAIAFQEFEEWRTGPDIVTMDAEGNVIEDMESEGGHSSGNEDGDGYQRTDDISASVAAAEVEAMEAVIGRLPDSYRYSWPEDFAHRGQLFARLRARYPDYYDRL